MGIGILVCGLNGSGKSTLGKVLAEKLDYHFIDNEDLFFPKTDPNYTYVSPRFKSEVERLLMDEVKAHKNFVFAAVCGDSGKEILTLYNYAVLIDVPKEIRMQRVRNRSFQKFGNRKLKGGDLYEEEERFFQFVSNRPDDYVVQWLQSLYCPTIRIDGAKPVEDNINIILDQIER